MRILVIEDDAAIRSVLVRGLTEEGFAVDEAVDGEEGFCKASDPAYDLIVLDLILPKKGGLTLLRELRSQGGTVPVLVLTARDAVPDRIRGLDDGADDYLVKPFAFEELLARIRALFRRSRRVFDPLLRVGPLALDRSARRVSWKETSVDLSNREFCILEYLMQHPGEVLAAIEKEGTAAAAPRRSNGGGAGLGLSITRAVVQSHGGRLRLENLPENGFRATIWLNCYEKRFPRV